MAAPRVRRDAAREALIAESLALLTVGASHGRRG